MINKESIISRCDSLGISGEEGGVSDVFKTAE